MIPKTVTEEQLWTALKPFYDLIGTTPMHVFNNPTVERDDNMTLHVRFQHAVEPGVEMDWPTGQTGDGEFDQKTYEVDITATSDDSVFKLWPRTVPESTRLDGDV